MGNPYVKKGVPGTEEDYLDDIVVTPQSKATTTQTQGSGNRVTQSTSTETYDNEDAEFGLAKGKSNIAKTTASGANPSVPSGITTTTTTTTTQPSTNGQSNAMNILDDAYKGTLGAFGDMVKTLEEERRIARQEDAEMKRREQNMQMISSIVDGTAALANLIGVNRGASNINLTSATGVLAPKFEAARAQRKADIKDIGTRLDQKTKELAAIKERYGSAKATLQAQDDAAKAAEGRFQKEMDFKQKSHEETMAFNFEKMRLDDAYRKLTLAETMRHNKAAERNAAASYSLAVKKYEQELKKNMIGLTCGDSIIDIPTKNVNTQTIGAIYNLVEPEVREKFFGENGLYDSKGKPTLEQMLAMVGMASQGDSANAVAIQTKIKALTGEKGRTLGLK